MDPPQAVWKSVFRYSFERELNFGPPPGPGAGIASPPRGPKIELPFEAGGGPKLSSRSKLYLKTDFQTAWGGSKTSGTRAQAHTTSPKQTFVLVKGGAEGESKQKEGEDKGEDVDEEKE